MEWFDRGKMVILRLTDLAIALLALGIILQLLFGIFKGAVVKERYRHDEGEQRKSDRRHRPLT